MNRIRIGTVGYTNALPLTDALDRDVYELVADHPRAIAAALAAGDVDIALVPVAAALTDLDALIAPGWCVGADGPVHSVVIVAETPPSDWTTLLLDGSSRTSAVLAQLLVTQGPLSDDVRDDLVIETVDAHTAPARVGGTTAALVIGDPARELPDHLTRWDLAELWKQWTGLPFVFAVWAGRRDLPASVRRDLRVAGAAGTSAIPAHYTGDDLAYLTEHIRFPLDERALMGLRRFASLAYQAGLVGSEHVSLYAPEVTRRPRAEGAEALLSEVVDGAVLRRDGVVALWRDARDADLAVAAHLVRAGVRPGDEAGYGVVHRVAADAADGFDAALGAAADADAVGIRLLDVGALGAAALHDRVARAAATGLQVLGVPVASLHRLAIERGLPLAVTAQDLADAGVSALDLPIGRTEVDVDAIQSARAAGLPVHAHLHADADADVVADRLDVLRRSAATGALSAVTIHLALPEGALVEPGRATHASWLRTVSLARLVVPGLHVVSSPETQGADGAQAALFVGADDLGEVGAGPSGQGEAGFEVSVAAGERALAVAGFTPVRRDAAFRALGGALTRLRKVRPVEERARLTG